MEDFEEYGSISLECEDTRNWKLDFVEHKLRVARKEYTCVDCGKLIKAGSFYMDFATKVLRTKFCIECGKIACGGPIEE